MFTRDFVYLVVSALQVILATLVTPILTRLVGEDQFGQFALAVMAMQILGPIFSFGLPFASQKIYAEENGDRRARGVLAVSAVLTVAAWFVVVLAAPWWGPAVGVTDSTDALLAATWGALFALTWTSLAMLRSRENLRVAIFVSALQSLGAQAAGIALLYLWAPTVESYLCGAIIGQAAAALVGFVALRPDWSALLHVRRHGPALLFGLPMVPQQLSVFILFAGDRIVISHDLGSGAVGRYSVAYNVGSLGVLLLVFVNQAWTPRIYAMTNRDARSRLLASSRDLMNLLLVPVVCGLVAAAPLVLQIWAPPSFDPTALIKITAIVAVCTFPYGQFLSNVRALMSEGRTGRAAVMTLAAAAVNVALNIVLVPHIGLTGSAIATLISYALLARLTRPPTSADLKVPGASLLLGLVIGAGLAITVVMAELPSGHEWLIFRVAVSAGALFAFLFLLRRAMSDFEALSRRLTRAATRGRHRRS
jgi:O-antigen/teichoic acid export membrane protein